MLRCHLFSCEMNPLPRFSTWLKRIATRVGGGGERADLASSLLGHASSRTWIRQTMTGSERRRLHGKVKVAIHSRAWSQTQKHISNPERGTSSGTKRDFGATLHLIDGRKRKPIAMHDKLRNVVEPLWLPIATVDENDKTALCSPSAPESEPSTERSCRE